MIIENYTLIMFIDLKPVSNKVTNILLSLKVKLSINNCQ